MAASRASLVKIMGGGEVPARRAGAPPPGSAGFSLLEVLVATTLMGLVLVTVLQVLTTAFRAQEASRRHSQAILVAEKVLQEYAGEQTPAAGTYQGRDGQYSYRVRLTPQDEYALSQTGGKVTSTLIQVTVSWQEQGRAKSLELETIRCRYQRTS